MIDIESKIKPLLKWPGGKFDELQFISPEMPLTISRYFEPFLGGGAVYLSMPPSIPAYVNDKSYDLINFYCMIQSQDETFFSILTLLMTHWRSLETFLVKNETELLRYYLEFRDNQIDQRLLRLEINNFWDRHTNCIETDVSPHVNYDLPFYMQSLCDSVFQKMKRMKKIELKKGIMSQEDIRDNIESAIKAGFYYYVRHLYNYAEQFDLSTGEQASIFFFMRENAYGAMFRFNKQGHFNIPYGGIGYNRKNLELKIEHLTDTNLLERLQNTQFGNEDFSKFMENFTLQENDFLFLDPPYDTEFSSYDQNPFGQDDQRRLANFLINDCKANFMLVIKSTDFILSLYEGKGLNIQYFDKKYMYTVKERNNRDVVHLLIKNY